MSKSPKLHSIALGLRFRPNFKIEDSLGAIIDEILYDEKSQFFTPKNFPFTRNNINEKILMNNETKDYLLINNSNLISELYTERHDDESIFANFGGAFSQDVLEKIIKKRKITAINRIGLLHRYVVSEDGISKNLINRTLGVKETEIVDFSINYSTKKAVPEAIAKKAINDFYTIIYNITKEMGNNDLVISIDFQRNFSPLVETYEQLTFEKFIKEAEQEISKELEQIIEREVALNV